MTLYWATRIAELGRMRPAGHGLDSPVVIQITKYKIQGWIFWTLRFVYNFNKLPQWTSRAKVNHHRSIRRAK